MNRTIEYYEARAHLLEERDAMGNKRIISKLKRKIRAMAAQQNKG